MGTKIKIKFGDVKFEYKGEAKFDKDDLLDLISALYQGSVWEGGWEEFEYDEDEKPEDDDSDDDDDESEDEESEDEDDESDDDFDGDDEADEDDDSDDEDEEDEQPELDDLIVDDGVELDEPIDNAFPVDEDTDDAPEPDEDLEEFDIAEPFSPLQCDPADLDAACGVIVAERLGADNPASTVLSAAATLELVEGVSPFTRTQLREALAASGEYASESYLHNLSRTMGDLLEDGILIEQRAEQYRLSADTRRDLEAKLA